MWSKHTWERLFYLFIFNVVITIAHTQLIYSKIFNPKFLSNT